MTQPRFLPEAAYDELVSIVKWSAAKPTTLYMTDGYYNNIESAIDKLLKPILLSGEVVDIVEYDEGSLMMILLDGAASMVNSVQIKVQVE